jgi:hypothetical protein
MQSRSATGTLNNLKLLSGAKFHFPAADRSLTARLRMKTCDINNGYRATRVSPEYLAYLSRHAGGDWGNVSRQHAANNRKAVRQGGRILSACPIDPAKPCKGPKNMLWIVTEADRSATTFLLPGENEEI